MLIQVKYVSKDPFLTSSVKGLSLDIKQLFTILRKLAKRIPRDLKWLILLNHLIVVHRWKYVLLRQSEYN